MLYSIHVLVSAVVLYGPGYMLHSGPFSPVTGPLSFAFSGTVDAPRACSMEALLAAPGARRDGAGAALLVPVQ